MASAQVLFLAIFIAACNQAESPSEDVAATVTEPRNLSGIWWAGTEAQTPELVGAETIPLNAAGQERYLETKAETESVKAGENNLEDPRKCVNVGTPRIWSQPFPFEIVHSAKMTAIAYEHNHVYRLIYMDEPQITDADVDVDEMFMGHSVGHWEDDTLVIDTVRIRTRTVLDDTGLPHGTQLHVVERIRKTADDTLEVMATVEDPEFYSSPWTARWTFKRQPDAGLREYICGFGAYETRYTTQ